MKITKEWLKSKEACQSGLDYVYENGYIGLEAEAFIRKLMDEDRLSDVSWLITRTLCKKGNISYAIYAAKQVLSIFEIKYPGDDRPRKAIEATESYLKNPCKKTIDAANAAANAANAAAYAANAAANAAYAANAAAYAANAAAYAANAAANAAYAANAAAYAANAAAYAVYAAADANADRAKIQTKILEYGIKLIKEAV